VKLDLAPMASAASLLEGEHDFAAFRSVGTRLSSTRRRIFRSLVRDPGFEEMFGSALQPALRGGAVRLFAYEVTGNGFLRHMVRTIAGSLIEIGAGRERPDWLRDVLVSGDRDLAGPTAPAKGLFLVRVGY
jgi:tRNA pseudouridine38-40 synthase